MVVNRKKKNEWMVKVVYVLIKLFWRKQLEVNLFNVIYYLQLLGHDLTDLK